jgi:hypothetical protein
MTSSSRVDALEQHKAIARRWSEELWNKANLAIADEIVAVGGRPHVDAWWTTRQCPFASR